jgi:cephalosporin hydroxylase
MDEHDPKDMGLIDVMGTDDDIASLANELLIKACRYRYSYNFTWLGRPIIQFPADMIATQEIIFKVKPQIIIETGIAHGGSLIFSASILQLLGGTRRVLGIDIDIRSHNRVAIEAHPMSQYINLLQGSSIDEELVQQVRQRVAGRAPILVILDSNHSHAHVIRELELYSPLVTNGSYLIVQDTIVQDMPADVFPGRPWGPNNNPKTAVVEFLKGTSRFEIDDEYDHKLLMTGCPSGFLRCISE